MSEFYSRLHKEEQLRLDEGARVGYGFTLPASNHVPVVPIAPKMQESKAMEVAAQMAARAEDKLVDVTGFEPATPCLQSRCSPS